MCNRCGKEVSNKIHYKSIESSKYGRLKHSFLQCNNCGEEYTIVYDNVDTERIKNCICSIKKQIKGNNDREQIERLIKRYNRLKETLSKKYNKIEKYMKRKEK